MNVKELIIAMKDIIDNRADISFQSLECVVLVDNICLH